tara:strand:- start:1331 stop:1669 length:339 start_codon:yes stop_codon:yes gene_type:complete
MMLIGGRNNKMIYSFRQNNSGGYYTKPAKNIIVKNARDASHAIEIATDAGMYVDGVASGVDCSCCGDRWYGIDDEHDTLDDAIAWVSDGYRDHDGIPQYIVVDDLDVLDTVL